MARYQSYKPRHKADRRRLLDVAAMRLCLLATNSESSFMASVQLTEADNVVDVDGRYVDRVDLDLSANAAKTILEVFARVDGETVSLSVSADGRSVQVTDVSGLVPGLMVRVPAMSKWEKTNNTQRVDAARIIFLTCVSPLALQTTCTLPSKTMVRWLPTVKAQGPK